MNSKGNEMIGDIPMVTKVRPTGGGTLRVRFAGYWSAPLEPDRIRRQF